MTDKHDPRPHDFRHRSANHYAVLSLDSLLLRGVITRWVYLSDANLFEVHGHWNGGPQRLTGKEVGTFETGAIAVLNAVIHNGLTVAEIHRGVAGLKPVDQVETGPTRPAQVGPLAP